MKRILIAMLAAIMLILPACSQKYERDFFAMNTYMHISVQGDKELLDKVERKIMDIDAKFSVTGEMGEVFALNRDGVLNAPSKELVQILECAKILYERTGGAYDITSYSLKMLWQSCEKEGREPTEAEISDALALVGMDKLTFSNEKIELNGVGGIDLGSIAKGYAGREAAKLLKDGGAEGGILTLGGNIVTFGKKSNGQPYKIGITDPSAPENICGYVQVGEANIVTSGKYNRSMIIGDKKLNHIINARTGQPCDNGIASVTVICEDGMWADALSTALFLLGEQGALEYYKAYGGFEAVIIMDDGRIITTSDKAMFVPS